ncbi:MAG: hypothetical protein DRO09_01530 [Thermoprotei archaeon]|nr:MAG: hypothetical protein DRO09_01530 [Thermoprotei archaeon]
MKRGLKDKDGNPLANRTVKVLNEKRIERKELWEQVKAKRPELNEKRIESDILDCLNLHITVDLNEKRIERSHCLWLNIELCCKGSMKRGLKEN